MVTYGVLIWSTATVFFLGCSVGMLINEGLYTIKEKIETRKEADSDEREKM